MLQANEYNPHENVYRSANLYFSIVVGVLYDHEFFLIFGSQVSVFFVDDDNSCDLEN